MSPTAGQTFELDTIYALAKFVKNEICRTRNLAKKEFGKNRIGKNRIWQKNGINLIERIFIFEDNDYIGTALRASVHVHLPKLAQFPAIFQAIAFKYQVQIRGIDGEHSKSDSNIYDVSNKRRLGRSEVQLVQDMIRGVQALIKVESVL